MIQTKQMEFKRLMVFVIALFAIVLCLSAVSALETSDITVNDVIVNDVSVMSHTAAGFVSNTIPVEVKFTANANLSETRVKVYVEGYKSEISETSAREDLIEGSTYIQRFTLTLPSSMDLDDLTEGLKLWVRFSNKDGSFENPYALKMQRDTYSLNILSVEVANNVDAGSVIPVDVVVENNGLHRLDNVFVKASIPELGIERTVYFGDITPQDTCDDEDNNCDNEDTVSKRIYLSVPRNAATGIYEIEIEAYNYDESVTAIKKISITEAETGVLSAVTSKTIAVGEEASFDLVLVNPNDRMVIYTITPEESTRLLISVSEPIATVAADSSKTVKVTVKATDSAEQGTHIVTLNINSESGLVKQVSYSVNVEGKQKASSIVILTVVLAIIFVVLLIVLIVLLSRKPAPAEEYSETNYY